MLQSRKQFVDWSLQVPLLKGEVIFSSSQDITFLCSYSSPEIASKRGTLVVTNYRLYFYSHQTKEHPVVLDLPLGFVSKVDKAQKKRCKVSKINTGHEIQPPRLYLDFYENHCQLFVVCRLTWLCMRNLVSESSDQHKK